MARRVGRGWWAVALGCAALEWAGCGTEAPEATGEEGDNPPQANVETAALPLSPGALQFVAEADATVAADTPATNAGSSTRLYADASPQREVYMRFRVQGLKGRVTRAFLRLTASDGTANGPLVYLTDPGWSESSITWDARPALQGVALKDVGRMPGYTGTTDVDVTRAVTGEGVYSFALVPESTDGVSLYSRDSASIFPPTLVVETEAVAPVGTVTRTLAPLEDTYVSSASPSSSYEGSERLTVDSSPESEAYLKFDVPATEGVLRSARLRVYASSGTNAAPAVAVMDPRWSAAALTWSTRPLRSASSGATNPEGPVSSGRWLEFDVTRYMRGPGQYGFRMYAGSSDAFIFHSMESTNAELRPRLVLTSGAPEGCGVRTYRRSGRGGVYEDSSVASDTPDTPHGAEASLRVDGSPEQQALLKGTVDALYDSVLTLDSVQLHLYATGDTVDGPRLHTARGIWYEDSVTWNRNRPTPEYAPLGNLGAVGAGMWQSYDVTRVFRWQNDAGFALVADSTDGVSFASLQAASTATRPYLEWTGRETYCERWGAGGAAAWARTDGTGADALVLGAAAVPGGGAAVLRAVVSDEPHEGDDPLPGATSVVRYDAAGVAAWARPLPSEAHASAVAVAEGGAVYVAGTYSGAPDLGGGALPAVPSGSRGLFVLALTPAGAHAWSRGYVVAPASDRYGPGVYAETASVDGMGGVVLTGRYWGAWTAAGAMLTESSGSPSYYVLALGSGGAERWVHDLQRAVQVWTVTGAPDGGAYVGGNTSGVQPYGAVVLRLGPDGGRQWTRQYAARGGSVQGLALTTDGNVAVAGTLRGTTQIAGVSVQAPWLPEGMPSLLLAKLTPEGQDVWGRVAGPTDHVGIRGVVPGPAGGFALLVDQQGAADRGGGRVGPESRVNANVVAAYAADGSHRWSLHVDRAVRSGDRHGARLIGAPDGVLVVGTLEANRAAAFDALPAGPSTTEDMLLLKLRD